MAESHPPVDSSVKRRSRRSTTDREELGRFAHRLSLDVTNDALALASHNGAPPSTSEQCQTVEEPPPAASSLSSTDRPQSLPNTPGGSGSRLTEAPSFEDCHKHHHHHRNPVGRIRDVSRTLVKWLRFKSKSINSLNERGEADPPWRPWRKSCKGGKYCITSKLFRFIVISLGTIWEVFK